MRASGGRSTEAERRGVLVALELSEIGTWEWDVVEDRAVISEPTACLFGFDARLVERGPCLADFISAIHPDDRLPFKTTVTEVTQRGGLFVAEYRVADPRDEWRWVLARGHFELDRGGRVRFGRGIVVDVTTSKREGYGEGRALFASDGRPPSLDTVATELVTVFESLRHLGEPYASEVGPALREALFRFASLAARTATPGDEPRLTRRGKLAS